MFLYFCRQALLGSDTDVWTRRPPISTETFWFSRTVLSSEVDIFVFQLDWNMDWNGLEYYWNPVLQTGFRIFIRTLVCCIGMAQCAVSPPSEHEFDDRLLRTSQNDLFVASLAVTPTSFSRSQSYVVPTSSSITPTLCAGRVQCDTLLDLKRKLPLTRTHTHMHVPKCWLHIFEMFQVVLKETQILLWCFSCVVDVADFGAMRLLRWVLWQRENNVATWTA